MFYNHHNCEGEVTVIAPTMGTRQGDPLGGALFALVHFKTLHFKTSCFLSYLFPSIVDGIHIIGPLSIISSTCMNISKLNSTEYDTLPSSLWI